MLAGRLQRANDFVGIDSAFLYAIDNAVDKVVGFFGTHN
jgi:hypothetical protein